MSEPKFYYARLTTPAKIRAGFDGSLKDGKPFYHDCAECKTEEPIIEGCIKDSRDNQVAIMPTGNGATFTACYYCKDCFEGLVNGAS